MSKQKELLVILEEIEGEIKRCCPDPYTCNSLTAHLIFRDKAPLLVKALRRAIDDIKESEGLYLANNELLMAATYTETLSDITAILNGERPQKEDLEEPGGNRELGY